MFDRGFIRARVLAEEFLKPLGISAYGLAAITADRALRLGRFFGMSAEFWLGLQMDYDPARTSVGDRLEREVRPWAA